MTANIVELKYYRLDGVFSGSTSYASEFSDRDGVVKQLTELNEQGRMPTVGGPIRGFVAIDITSREKDSEHLLRL